MPVITLRLPSKLKEAAEASARSEGKSLSVWIAETVMRRVGI